MPNYIANSVPNAYHPGNQHNAILRKCPFPDSVSVNAIIREHSRPLLYLILQDPEFMIKFASDVNDDV